MLTIVLTLSLVALVLFAVVLLLRFSPQPNGCGPAPGIDDSAWMESFSIGKYEPLVRLTCNADEDFVAATLGKEAQKAYVKLRRTIIRDYLRLLSSDFRKILEIATVRCVHVADDGAFSSALVEQQMNFIFQIWTIEARLFIGEFIPCQIRLDSLLSPIEVIAEQTRELTRSQLHYRVV